jgi:Zn-dependent protease
MTFELAAIIIALTVAITCHEAAHALASLWLGDGLPRKMGRISLNPLQHLTVIGTAAIFILGFGWGRPVVVNLYNYKKPRLYFLLSSIAGPLANLLLSTLCLGILHMHPGRQAKVVLMSLFIVNGMLAIFNLLPIPPLDGSKIWPCVIPGLKPAWSGKWATAWMMVLAIAVFTNGVEIVTKPAYLFLMSLLPH